ncbi:DUF995 domain-containing protein [Kaistia granuli]|uniref:DUF995 domain-containing protein n=1 Tax=Kaistia granuli TaxID=363259 RepID=UPI0006862503
MRERNSDATRAMARLRATALAALGAALLAGPAVASTAPVAAGEPPAGSAVMSAAELYVLYGDKSWQWPDGAGRLDSTDRRFTAWVDGEKGKSWAEGRWLVMDSGLMCLKADWHSGQEVFPARTCFEHRIGNGTIYQKKQPDGGWYVFRHAEAREDDEANKLVSADLVSGRFDELKPAQPPKARPAMKQQAKK